MTVEERSMSVEDILEALRAILDEAEGRSLSDEEVLRYEALEVELARARKDVEIRARQTAYETPVRDDLHFYAGGGEVQERANPLAYTTAALDALQAALGARTAVRVEAGLQERAALTTGTYGSSRVWGAAVTDGPRLLHVAAGVRRAEADAILAQHPKLVIPAASASVGEGVSLVEYASSTAGSLTMGRFGRFTDLSEESLIGADAGAVVGVHQLAIAKDLDKSLIDAVNTEAGAAVAFSADVPAAIRKSIATVMDNTAGDVEDITVIAHPDNVALLEDVAPTGGRTIAEPFPAFSGARVYASSAVPTGFMLVSNLRDTVVYFEAQTMRTVTDTNIKTDTVTVATAVVGGYAISLITGGSQKIDVVTP